MMIGFGTAPGEVTVPRGFTLAELMVTLALVAIVATLAAPSVRQSMRQADGRSAARATANQFRKARDHAISRGEVVFAKVERSGGRDSRGRVELLQTENNRSSCLGASTSSTVSLEQFDVADHSSNVSIRGASQWDGGGNQWICFSPTGAVHDENGNKFSTSNCGGGWRMWLSSEDPSTLSNSIDETACDLTGDDRIEQRDARYRLNMWVIDVPFNGGIEVNQ